MSLWRCQRKYSVVHTDVSNRKDTQTNSTSILFIQRLRYPCRVVYTSMCSIMYGSIHSFHFHSQLWKLWTRLTGHYVVIEQLNTFQILLYQYVERACVSPTWRISSSKSVQQIQNERQIEYYVGHDGHSSQSNNIQSIAKEKSERRGTYMFHRCFLFIFSGHSACARVVLLFFVWFFFFHIFFPLCEWNGSNQHSPNNVYIA